MKYKYEKYFVIKTMLISYNKIMLLTVMNVWMLIHILKHSLCTPFSDTGHR